MSPIDDVWAEIEQYMTPGLKAASLGSDGKAYFVPVYNYPWVVLYRKSLFEEKGYTIPTTIEEFKALGDKMKADGLVPLAFGDQDGWPAMGTFDILNMRLNGYDFHIGLMEGTEKWNDPKTKAVFEYWRDLLPYFQEGAPGRTWQDAAKAALVDKVAGMYFLGTFAVEQAGEFGTDVGFFPFPLLGTEFDGENAIDAPIDGFMLSANPKNPDAAKAFLKCVATPGGAGRLRDQPRHRQRRRLADGRHERLHRRPEDVGRSPRRTPATSPSSSTATRGPTSPGRRACRASSSDFLTDPNQDLDVFLGEIQAYYDTLPPQE